MSDLLDNGSFMFTSESVGEGHPGESSFSPCVVLKVQCTEVPNRGRFTNVSTHFNHILSAHGGKAQAAKAVTDECMLPSEHGGYSIQPSPPLTMGGAT